MTVAFTFKALWWVDFFALVPFFLVLLSCEFGIKKMIRYNLFFALGYFVPSIYWLYGITVLFPVSKILSLLMISIGILLIGLVQGFYTAAATMFFPSVKSGGFRDVLIFSSLYILGEFLQEYTFFAPFPWVKAAIPVSEFRAFIQSASLFGVYFVSFLILFINGSLAFILLNSQKKNRIKPILFMLIAVFAVNTGFGAARIVFSPKNTEFEAVAVQGNYSGLDKWSHSAAEMFDKYCELTRNGITPQTRLVVWPETAISTDINHNTKLKAELTALSSELDITIVTGFFTYEDNDMMYNTVAAISPDGSLSQPYNKHSLVPFGEYFPMSNAFKKFFPAFNELIENATSILAGKDFQILDSAAGKMGAIICYDSIFTDVARNNSRLGAQIFVLPSNDSWFGDSSALFQHNSQAVFRAVENNRYLVRASNTGISSVISPTGKIITSADTFVPAVISAQVSLIEKRTVYSYIGNIIIFIPLAVFLWCAFKTAVKILDRK
jgi:apolipoprotein N-acyltransferase